MDDEMYDIVIIGGGVSGLGAAIYAGRFQIKTAVVGEKLGGTIILTNDIANYPAFTQITGLDLADKLLEHVKDYDAEIVEKLVTRVERCPEGCFKVFTGNEYLHT